MARNDDVQCLVCREEVPSRQIVSDAEGSKNYQTCVKCVTEREAEELKKEAQKYRAKRRRRKKKITNKQDREVYAQQVKEFESEEAQREAMKRELARRRFAREHLLGYILRFKPSYKVGWVHKVVCAKLEKFLRDVKDKKSPRLMISMPPRAGKSEIVSDKFPGWALGRDPTLEFILVSHGISLPEGFSKENRARLRDDKYKVLFPETNINPDRAGVDLWKTTSGGGVQAAGVGGPITGHGADILIIDDPIKNYEEACSETIRESLHNWYSSTARTRLSPGGGIIIMATRWHDADLTGQQLREMNELRRDGVDEEEIEQWEEINFPGIAEHDEYVDSGYNFYNRPTENRTLVRKKGEALHPERFSLPELLRLRRTLGPQKFSALYQQNPIPESGDFFQKEDFSHYGSTPNVMRYPVYFAWDLAVGERRVNDWTVGVAAALVPQGGINVLYLLDMFRGRVRDQEQINAIVDQYIKYQMSAAELGMEYGQIFLSIEKALLREFRTRKVTPYLNRDLRPVQDKRVRATPLRNWMQNHRIKFPRDEPWVQKATEEMLRFDAGVNDDIVDAIAWLVRMVDGVPLVKAKQIGHTHAGMTVKQRLDAYYREQPNSENGSYMSA